MRTCVYEMLGERIILKGCCRWQDNVSHATIKVIHVGGDNHCEGEGEESACGECDGEGRGDNTCGECDGEGGDNVCGELRDRHGIEGGGYTVV